jgi:hypothetical protein
MHSSLILFCYYSKTGRKINNAADQYIMIKEINSALAAIEVAIAKTQMYLLDLQAAKTALAAVIQQAEQQFPGKLMADGTVYVGISPTDGRPLYAMPHDLTASHTWEQGQSAATAQTFGNQTDWRVPTKEELNLLYLGKQAIGAFKHDWYWSSSDHRVQYAWAMNLRDGSKYYGYKNCHVGVRCVRSG